MVGRPKGSKAPRHLSMETKAKLQARKELRDKEAVKLLGNIKDMHKVYGHMPQELIGLRNAIYDNLMRQSKDKFDNHKDVYGAL